MRLIPLLLLLLSPSILWAGTLPLPRFASIRPAEANLRAGPGNQYPIVWTYQKPGLPVEIIDELGEWRRVRDPEGDTGWVHHALLTGRRTLSVSVDVATLRRFADENAAPVVRLERGVTGALLGCLPRWCRAEVQEVRGWIRKGEFFGAYEAESWE
jgi:SH3-like domain-containing protein